MKTYKIINCDGIVNNANIVESLAKHRFVENIISKYCYEDTAQDLAQDIYLQLYESPNTVDLYNKKQLQFYITGACKKAIYSNTSKYYRTYKKLKDLSEGYEKIINKPEGIA